MPKDENNKNEEEKMSLSMRVSKDKNFKVRSLA